MVAAAMGVGELLYKGEKGGFRFHSKKRVGRERRARCSARVEFLSAEHHTNTLIFFLT